MAVQRSNFQSGRISDNPLLIGATLVNSAQFASLPLMGNTDVLKLTIDPNAVVGAPEICYVTIHGAGSTTVTVTRAQEATVARAHNLNEQWVVAPTAADWAGVPQLNAAAGRTTALVAGATNYDTDTFSLVQWTTITTGWQKPWNMPWGYVGKATITANQTGITTQVDLTGLTVTITVVANRRYRVTSVANCGQGISSGAAVLYLIVAGTQAAYAIVNQVANNNLQLVIGSEIEGLSAGATVFKLQASTNAGTLSVNASPGAPVTLLVEDIGPNGSPA